VKDQYVEIRYEPLLWRLLETLAKRPGASDFMGDPPDEALSPTSVLLRCSEVSHTDFGFLRLVPYQEEKHLDALPVIVVPSSRVAWICEDKTAHPVGFLTRPASEAPG
jgi:hypothetical protein